MTGAIDDLDQLIQQFERVDWSEIRGMDAPEAAAIQQRLVETRRQTIGEVASP